MMSIRRGRRRYHNLDTSNFRVALERYIDENKPDPIVRKQIEKWEFNYTNNNNNNSDNDKPFRDHDNNILPFEPTDVLDGQLQWIGDYMVAEIHLLCCWEDHDNNGDDADGDGSDDDDNQKKGKKKKKEKKKKRKKKENKRRRETEVKNDIDEDNDNGNDNKNDDEEKSSLYFALRTNVRFRSAAAEKPQDKEMKAEEKVRSKMVQRLRDDKYIRHILSASSSEEDDDDDDDEGKRKNNTTNTTTTTPPLLVLLCEAQIQVRTIPLDPILMAFLSPEQRTQQQLQQHLEERVDVVDTVAEGLHRALFSSAHYGSLDVMDLLLSLPLLPTRIHINQHEDAEIIQQEKKKKGMMIHCPLADRTKLRLLEDAMFDACEREGEEELIDELRIAPSISAAAVAANPKECHQNHRGKKKKYIKQVYKGN